MSTTFITEITVKPLVGYHAKKAKWRARIQVDTGAGSYRKSIGMYGNKQVAYDAAATACEVFASNGTFLSEDDIYDIKRLYVDIDRRSQPTPRKGRTTS